MPVVRPTRFFQGKVLRIGTVSVTEKVTGFGEKSHFASLSLTQEKSRPALAGCLGAPRCPPGWRPGAYKTFDLVVAVVFWRCDADSFLLYARETKHMDDGSCWCHLNSQSIIHQKQTARTMHVGCMQCSKRGENMQISAIHACCYGGFVVDPKIRNSAVAAVAIDLTATVCSCV